MIKRLSPYLLVVAGTLLPLLVWHWHNQGLPSNDAADYLKTVMRSYVVLQHDLWEGIKSLYGYRTWKTTFFPLISFPALLLTGNNGALAVSLTMMLVQIILGVYVFRFLRTKHAPAWATLICLVVMTIPILVTLGTTFLADNVLVLAIVGFFFHGLQTLERWETKSFLATVGWFVFGVLTRPIEALVITAPAMIFLVRQSYHRGLLSSTSLKMIVGLCCSGVVLAFLVIFGFQGHYPNFYRFISLLPLIIVVWGAFEMQRRQQGPFALILGLAVLVLFVWYVPYMGNLVKWIYTCTFGEMAQRTGGRSPGDWASYLLAKFKDLSGYVGVILIVAVFVSKKASSDYKIPWLWLVSIFPTFALGFLSHNSLSRYYIAPTVLLYICLALGISRPMSARGVAVCSLLLVALGLNILGIEQGMANPNHAGPLSRLISRVESPRRWDGHTEHYLFLTSHIQPRTGYANKTVVFIMEALHWRENDQMPDPWTLGMLSFQNGSLDDFDNGWTPKGASLDENIRSFHCNYDYLYIGPTDGRINYVWDNGSYLGKALIDAWKRGELSRYKLSQPVSFKTTPYSGRVMEFILFKTNPQALGCPERRTGFKRRLFE